MQQYELEAAILKIRNEGFDESFIHFCAKTFSSYTYPPETVAAARMHAFYLRLALDALCDSKSKVRILSMEHPGEGDVKSPDKLCLFIAGESYRAALCGESSFQEQFIRRWCEALAK